MGYDKTEYNNTVMLYKKPVYKIVVKMGIQIMCFKKEFIHFAGIKSIIDVFPRHG